MNWKLRRKWELASLGPSDYIRGRTRYNVLSLAWCLPLIYQHGFFTSFQIHCTPPPPPHRCKIHLPTRHWSKHCRMLTTRNDRGKGITTYRVFILSPDSLNLCNFFIIESNCTKLSQIVLSTWEICYTKTISVWYPQRSRALCKQSNKTVYVLSHVYHPHFLFLQTV
jgi:hypothetical protein